MEENNPTTINNYTTISNLRGHSKNRAQKRKKTQGVIGGEPMNRISKDNINLVRLINRLEKNTTLEITKLPAHDPHPSSHDQPARHRRHQRQSSSDSLEVDRRRYWELKSLETTIRYAKTILETINSNPATLNAVSQIHDPIELRSKLDQIQNRIDFALKDCPDPVKSPKSPYSQSLIHGIKTPELPAIPSAKSEALADVHVKSLAEKDEELSNEREGDGIDKKEKAQKPSKLEPQPPSNPNSNQEELTQELSQMAAQLKKNVHHFNKLLVEDQSVLVANQTKLELNSNSMTKEGARLSQVSLKNRSMTWFTIAAVAAVAISWILMFIIIRLTWLG